VHEILNYLSKFYILTTLFMGTAKRAINAAACPSPRERAAFAGMSRLISCVVTEQILPALYFALDASKTLAHGFMLVGSMPGHSGDNWILHADNIFIIVPLCHTPVLGRGIIADTGRPIELVDPLDMLPFFYQVENRESVEEWVRRLFFFKIYH
jgi:hypothetical protein